MRRCWAFKLPSARRLLPPVPKARRQFALIAGFLVFYVHGALSQTTLAEAALYRTTQNVRYDGAYRSIPYPGGDVPKHTGVCTDVLIRSYRTLGIDLQKLVHEDMKAHFAAYPKTWGLKRPDPNIDHRRVLNLETFFARHGQIVPVTSREQDYVPGDIVSWRLENGLPHIGVVGEELVSGTKRHVIIHNIGAGPQAEDILFAYRVHGHFRFAPTKEKTESPGGF